MKNTERPDETRLRSNSARNKPQAKGVGDVHVGTGPIQEQNRRRTRPTHDCQRWRVLESERGSACVTRETRKQRGVVGVRLAKFAVALQFCSNVVMQRISVAIQIAAASEIWQALGMNLALSAA